MVITITIDTSSDALTTHPLLELKYLLDKAVSHHAHCMLGDCEVGAYPLMDSNGNKVGDMVYSD